MPPSDDLGRRRGVGADAVIGFLIILFALAFLWQTAALPEPFDDAPGPALFPAIILSGLLIAGVTLVLSGLRQSRRADGRGAEPGGIIPVLGMLATIAAYVLALRWTSFLIATPAMIALAALVALRFRASRAEVVVVAAAAIAGTLLIEVVFIDGLGIRL